MKKLTREQLLLQHIEYLEAKRDTELRELKYQVHRSVQSLNPFASFFSTDNDAPAADIKTNIAEGVVNWVSQMLFQKTFLRYFQEPVKDFLRNLINRFL